MDKIITDIVVVVGFVIFLVVGGIIGHKVGEESVSCPECSKCEVCEICVKNGCEPCVPIMIESVMSKKQWKVCEAEKELPQNCSLGLQGLLVCRENEYARVFSEQHCECVKRKCIIEE